MFVSGNAVREYVAGIRAADARLKVGNCSALDGESSGLYVTCPLNEHEQKTVGPSTEVGSPRELHEGDRLAFVRTDGDYGPELSRTELWMPRRLEFYGGHPGMSVRDTPVSSARIQPDHCLVR
jgi:hypothetical protein